MPIGSGQVQLGNDCRDEYVLSSGQIAISSLYRQGTYVPDITQTSTIPTSGAISFFNFRNTQLTTSTNFINQSLLNIQFIVKGSSPDAVCSMTFNSNGDFFYSDGGGNTTSDWVNDVSGTPGNYYQIYTSVASGDSPAGDSLSTWLDLSTSRSWSLTQTGGVVGTKANTLLVYIRGKYPQVNIGQITVDMTSQVTN